MFARCSCSSMIIITWACSFVTGGIEDSDANTLGRKTKFDEYRSLAAIYHSTRVMPICAGLVIGNKKVLTSCSCIAQCEPETEAFPETAKALYVVSGNVDADNPQHEVRTVVDIIPHPYCDFAWNGTKADLAVLVLNKGVTSCPGSHVDRAQVYSPFEIDALKQQLIQLTLINATCEIATYGYYSVSISNLLTWGSLYSFVRNHSMRAFETYFGTPHETCYFSCPNSTYCERDFYNRDDICQVGKVSRVGPCGVLPGSPVFCKGVFWGMYTGHRFCHGNDSLSVLFKGAAMPTIISFYDFYKTHAFATKPMESFLHYLSLVLLFLMYRTLNDFVVFN